MSNNSREAEVPRNGDTNDCFVCKKVCNKTCSRCGEFFCSKNCQSIGWRDHKYVCFEMPELIVRPTTSNGQPNRNHSNFNNVNRKVFQHKQNGFNENGQSTSKTASSAEPKQKTFNFADAPKNNDDVTLTCVENANTFYIRACENDDEFMKNAKDFDHHGRSGRKLSLLPQRCDIVLAKYDSLFIRAVVLKVESQDRIQVAFADTGRKGFRKIHDLRQLSDELISRTRFNFKINLNTLPNGTDEQSFTKLINFVRDKIVFTLQFDGNDWESATNFNLLRKDCGSPIGMLIGGEANNLAAKKTTPTEVHIPKAPVEENPIEPREKFESTIEPREKLMSPIEPREKLVSPIQPRENLVSPIQPREKLMSPKPISLRDLTTETLPEVADLTILDDSGITTGCVTVILTRNIKKQSDLHEKINERFDKIAEVYEPQPDELCLVKFEDEWYRAVYYSPRFCLIDYCSMVDIDSHDVRKYPKELTDPCYVFFGNIQGFSPASLDQLKKALEPGSQHLSCLCSKVTDEPNEYDVTFPSVSAKVC